MKEIVILNEVHNYVQKLKLSESAKLLAQIEALQSGDYDSINTKQLREKVRELILGNHRFIYFEYENILYFTNAFRKKSNKTPKKEIDYAENILKKLTQ